MHSFSYRSAASVDDAIALRTEPYAAYIAGGTDILNVLRDGADYASALIDVRHVREPEILVDERGAQISAFATMRDAADHEDLAEGWPVLRAALLAGASPQVRNMATLGGNLMQRTRCWYFRDPGSSCNKKRPGSGCPARDGEHRWHAVFGGSDHCVAVHPSDLAVALTALDAQVTVRGSDGERRIEMGDFYRLPEATPEIDTTVQAGELILEVFLPRVDFAANSTYVKVRDRASFEFALVSCAAALAVVDGEIRDARVVLGGVAAKPWRARAAEDYLRGRQPTPETFMEGAGLGAEGAHGLPGNRFKIDLIPGVVTRALERLV